MARVRSLASFRTGALAPREFVVDFFSEVHVTARPVGIEFSNDGLEARIHSLPHGLLGLFQSLSAVPHSRYLISPRYAIVQGLLQIGLGKRLLCVPGDVGIRVECE